MGSGRFLFVGVPFGLTFASMVCILMVILGGTTNKGLDLFEVNVQNFSVAPSTLQQIQGVVTRSPAPIPAPNLSDLTIAGLTGTVDPSVNVTATDLGLSDFYQIYLFSYCSRTGTNTTCSGAQYNWAARVLNSSNTITTSTGVLVTLPKTVRNSLNVFVNVSRLTQVSYLSALVTVIIELIVGVFAICSRVGSCCTFIVAAAATLAIGVASVLATVQATVIVGTIDATSRIYGVDAYFKTQFLSVTWLAVAFSLGASMFWLLSMCCCASDQKSSSKKSAGGFGKFGPFGGGAASGEKAPPTGAYHRVEDSTYYGHGQQSGILNPGARQEYAMTTTAAKPTRERGDGGAFEPYSHTRV